MWAETLESGTDKLRARLLLNKSSCSIPGLDAISLTIAAGAGGTIVPIEIDLQSA